MAYRTAARPDAVAEAADEGPLLVVSARGERGASGVDGASGLDGRSAGDDGTSGGSGQRGGRGGRGGTVALELASVPGAPTAVRIEGTRTTAAGSVAVRETLDFEREAAIGVEASGGRGGRGGDGGSGGAGARGVAGADATRYSSGDDGGPGGHGGDAGAGADGGPGGAGGKVTIRVSEDDTHLFMLVEPNVRGGAGGDAGDNGAPGRGGDGGRGGSSYQWTETETSTDAEGRTTTSTTYRSSSGGSDGRAGRHGRSSAASSVPGVAGAPGTIALEVCHRDGTVASYPRRYDVRLRGFEHENQNDDGIYEPGETVRVHAIEIENVGAMPLPTAHDVVVTVAEGAYVVPDEDARGRRRHLVVPRGLGPGQRHVFSEELALTLASHAPRGPGEPLAAAETIRLEASLPAAKRAFRDLDHGVSEARGKIVVRFPIEVSPIVGLSSVAAGQVTKVRLTVRNVSRKPFGAATTTGRALGLRVTLGYGELGAGDVVYFHEDGTTAPLDGGAVTPISFVDANDEVEIEAKLGVRESAPPYASARLVVACEVAPVDGKGPPRTIQLREHVVRVGRACAESDGDVLVLVNDRTTPEELAGWEAHVAKLGLRVATWDVSLEDGVAILDEIARGERSFRAVVVLDAPMANGRRASALVGNRLALALARRGIALTFVGGGKKLADLAVPTAEVEAPRTFAPGAESAEVLSAIEALEAGEGSVAIAHETTYAMPWSQVSREGLDREAAKLAAALEHRAPAKRFVVVPRYVVGDTAKTAFVRHVRTGTVEVRRTTDGAPATIRNVTMDDAASHSAEAVRDLRLFFVLLLTLPFAVKLRLLLDGSFSFEDDGDPFVLAVLADLVAESSPWAATTFGALEEASLPRHALLAAEAAQAPKSDAAARRIASLLAGLRVVAHARVRWWHWLPPLPWLTRAQKLRRSLAATARRFEAVLPRGAADLAAARERLSARASERPDRAPAVFVEDTIAAAGASLLRKTDEDVLPVGERVVDAEAFDALVEKDRAQAARARETRETFAAARESLLEARTVDELLADATRVRIAAAPPEDQATAADLAGLLEDTPAPGRSRAGH